MTKLTNLNFRCDSRKSPQADINYLNFFVLQKRRQWALVKDRALAKMQKYQKSEIEGELY